MDFMTSVRTCLLEKYAEFNGRATRPEFWWFALFCFVLHVIGDMVFRNWIMGLVGLALLVPSIAAGSRRLHDTGKSGWLQLLWFIPVIGWAVLIYLEAQPGQPESNQYGAPPADTPPAPPEAAPGPQ